MTITDKSDVTKALEECIQTAEKLAGSNTPATRASFQQYLPPLRITLVPVGEGVQISHSSHFLPYSVSLLSQCI